MHTFVGHVDQLFQFKFTDAPYATSISYGGGEYTDIRVIQGTNITLTCRSTSKPAANYTWTYPGGTYTGSTLSLVIQTSHEGDIRCTAENNMRASSGLVVKGNDTTFLSVKVLCKYLIKATCVWLISK